MQMLRRLWEWLVHPVCRCWGYELTGIKHRPHLHGALIEATITRMETAYKRRWIDV